MYFGTDYFIPRILVDLSLFLDIPVLKHRFESLLSIGLFGTGSCILLAFPLLDNGTLHVLDAPETFGLSDKDSSLLI